MNKPASRVMKVRFTLALCLVAGGCHEWGLLLTAPDLSPVADLLVPCGIHPNVPAVPILHVEPGGLSLQAAVAQAQSGPAVILVAEGSYTANLDLGGEIAMYGGYYDQFRCRDWVGHPTVVKSGMEGSAPLTVETGSVTLGGVELVGLASANSAVTASGLTQKGGRLTVEDSQIFSHQPTTDPSANASALKALSGDDLTLRRTRVTAGSAASSSVALFLCNTPATVEDSTLTARNAGAAFALDKQDNNTLACALTSDAGLILRKSALSAEGAPSIALRFNGGRSAKTVISGSALAALGPDAIGLYLYRPPAVDLLGSTFYANPNATGSDNAAIYFADAITLRLADSLVVGPVPLRSFVAHDQLAITFAGKNYYSAKETFVDSDMGSLRLILDAFDVQWSIFEVQSIDPSAEISSMPLMADGLHLNANALAVDHASQCWEDHDIDGELRPKNRYCDVGGDEL